MAKIRKKYTVTNYCGDWSHQTHAMSPREAVHKMAIDAWSEWADGMEAFSLYVDGEEFIVRVDWSPRFSVDRGFGRDKGSNGRGE